MRTKYAIHLAFCVATIAFAITFVFPAFFPTSLLWYQPAERQWSFGVQVPGIAMDFYGRCLFATLISTVSGCATYLVARRLLHRDPRGATVAVLTIWAMTLTTLVIAFYVWRLVHRIPAPPPIPAWYQPR
jgi:hypothetical protein